MKDVVPIVNTEIEAQLKESRRVQGVRDPISFSCFQIIIDQILSSAHKPTSTQSRLKDCTAKARPIAFEEMLLKMVTSSILRAHISQVRRSAGAYQFGIYHEGGAPEIAWKIHAKMAADPTKVFIACDIKNGFGAVRRNDAIEGARRWCLVLGTVFANLWAVKQSVQPTAWASTPGGSWPITVRDGLLQGACEAPVDFALALRVAMMVFEDEMRKQGVELATELEYSACVDDITIATTAELAPIVMGKLKEILERHGLELRRDKCREPVASEKK